jgi:hypothetical protein
VNESDDGSEWYCQPTMAAIYLWGIAVFMAHWNAARRDPWA